MAGQYIEPMPLPGLAGRVTLPSPPTLCEVCRRWSRDALCADCGARFAPTVPRCLGCGLRLGSAGGRCGTCLRDPPPYERTVVAFDYAFPWDRLIVAFKFEGRVELAGMLAARLAQAIGREQAERPAPPVDVVVPVPLSATRLRERGFNQSWELARRLARTFGIAAQAHGLLRALDTAHQAQLSRAERERNLRAAFTVAPAQRTRWAGRRLALVDDVMTTGATAREAAAALRRAGAATVELWVLARTPAPDPAA
jgi:ComF family protein